MQVLGFALDNLETMFQAASFPVVAWVLFS